MSDHTERKRLAILRILNQSTTPVSSQKIASELNNMGHDISERTVRFHLQSMDKDQLTSYVPKQGRVLTEPGRLEISKTKVHEKIGFLNAKIDQLTYLMDFDVQALKGNVISNVSIIKKSLFEEHFRKMLPVFQQGYAMGEYLAILKENESIDSQAVPRGCVGIGTVCSITLNGILLQNGIPMYSRFGGLLEITRRKPQRFVAIINYDGTTIDPLEIFIKSRMTDYLGVTSTGSGLVGAGFREIPSESREGVREIKKKLQPLGLDGFLEIGQPEQPLYGIPVNEGRVGVVVIGGLNPVAIFEESNIEVHSRALSGLVPYDSLFHYSRLKEKL